MDWMGLLLDAHFTVLVMTPEARGLLTSLHSFVKSQVALTFTGQMFPQKQAASQRRESRFDIFLCPQVRLVSELGKIEASFQELDKMKVKRDVGQYSIEIIELL